jgi:hypothetical protein
MYWMGFFGRPNIHMIKSLMPKPSDRTLIMYSGSGEMADAIKKCLINLEYNVKKSTFWF